MVRPGFRFLSCLLISTAALFSAEAEDALHTRIDQLVEKTAIGPRADRADDPTFLRRIYLDLTGRVPLSSEARAFLADQDPDKRTKVIDRLLASDEFARHLATVLDVMLMERRAGKHVKTAELRSWLRKRIAENQPFNQTAALILGADGSSGENRAAAAFLMERDVEPNLLTREISRMFFGMDLQCAQCHDHPIISDYIQTDYYGVYAFVNRTSLFRPDNKKPGLLAESASGDASFKSVFTDREAFTGPRLPGGSELTEPVFAPGDEYKVKPAKNVRHIPKYSRRARLAELIAAGGNPVFDRNVTNRLWAILMGRGLVHPVDRHHSENPPTNPELLDLLAADFAASKYDVRRMLREIALTDVYQRSYRLPADLAPSVDAAKKAIPELTTLAGQAEKKLEEAEAASEKALEQLDAALAEAKPLRDAVAKARQAAADPAKKRDAAVKALNDKQNAVNAKKPIADTVKTTYDNAAAAAKLVTDDKELTAAVAILKKKSDALAAEVAKLTKEAEALKKPAADAEAKLAESNKPVQGAVDKAKPAEEKIRQRRADFVATRDAIRRARAEVTYTKRRIEFLTALVSLAEADQRLAQIRPEIPRAESAATSAQTAMAEATKTMQAADAALARSKATHEAAARGLTEAQAQLTSTQSGAKFATESLAGAKAALAKLGEDKELAQAVSILTASSSRLQKEAASAGELVKTRTTAARTAKSDFDQNTTRQQQAKQAFDKAKTASDAAAAKLAALKADLAKFEPQAKESSDKVIDQASSNFNIAVLEALSPEQLAWSTLFLTGAFEQQRAAQRAKLTKEKPLSDADKKDATKVAAREKEIEEATFTALAGSVNKFVGLYAGQKGQPQDAFFATVDQALFASNAGDLISWLNPSGENLTGRLVKLEEPKALAEELYLSILTRMPTDDEVASVNEYLTQRKDDRNAAVKELAWALITSVEFRFHH